MIRHVVERALLTKLPVQVCTDSHKIADLVSDLVPVFISDPSIPNGTVRIAQAAESLPKSELIIDVQGDDPFVDPETILDVAAHLKNKTNGCFVPYSVSSDPVRDSIRKSIVKIMPNHVGDKVITMSRHQFYSPNVPILKHSSVIGFVNTTLQEFVSLPKTSLEHSESIELMRLIEHGIPCYTWKMLGVPGISIDTLEDLERARLYCK